MMGRTGAAKALGAAETVVGGGSVIDAETMQDAAAMLRRVLAALPPQAPVERATARRIEGAAVALSTLAVARTDPARPAIT
jgi:hypothetical protein